MCADSAEAKVKGIPFRFVDRLVQAGDERHQIAGQMDQEQQQHRNRHQDWGDEADHKRSAPTATKQKAFIPAYLRHPVVEGVASMQKECLDEVRQEWVKIIERQEQQEILHEPNNRFDLECDCRKQ